MRLRKTSLMRKLLLFGYNWVKQVCDPLYATKGILGFLQFAVDCWTYKRMPGAERIRILDTYPFVHDRGPEHEFAGHYFYLNAWAMRCIVYNNPSRHVDIGSQSVLASLLSSVLPVVFLDYRILRAALSGLDGVCGSITELPFRNGSIKSLSCLHVAEHIGLGRYGDPLSPDGTRRAARELKRVLAVGGNLFFAVPVGRPRLCFNAHRILSAETICDYFAGLDLIEFSGVHDDRRFVEKVELGEFENSDYACGMFWFRKPGHNQE